MNHAEPLRPPGWRGKIAPGALLRGLLARRGSIEAPLGPAWRDDLRTIRETRAATALLLSDAAAMQIIIGVRAARRLGGAMAEAGVLTGGSARLICAAKGEARLHLFDVFETQQGASDEAGAELRRHFGAIHGSRASVERLLAPYAGVTLHPGIFPASARGLEDERFAFVHLDMDLVSSTRAGLAFFLPRLLPGGILIGDDYADPGVRHCFAERCGPGPDTMIELPWGQVMVVKQG